MKIDRIVKEGKAEVQQRNGTGTSVEGRSRRLPRGPYGGRLLISANVLVSSSCRVIYNFRSIRGYADLDISRMLPLSIPDIAKYCI